MGRSTNQPIPAATIVLLRDGARGLETFLIERSSRSPVLGGAHVFPGGKLDPADSDPPWLSRCEAPLGALVAALGEPSLPPHLAGGLYAAACRETYEEAGVLLCGCATPDALAAAGDEAAQGTSFHAMLERSGLRLDWQALVPWLRWITPTKPHLFRERFDARFFLARLPAGQIARHDAHEAVAGMWTTPREALDEWWKARMRLAPAQIMSLAALARHPRVDDVLSDAARRRPPTIAIEAIEHDGMPAVAFPGDPRHPVAERALAGPSFLVYRDGRFEPLDGLRSLLS